MTRILNVARMHLVAWPSVLGWPWAILASSFLINLAIFAAIGDRVVEKSFTGGLASIYIVVLISCGQWVTQVFPFAMGLSVTRRAFYAATSLLVVAQAVVFAILLYLFKVVEDATGGWGINLRFFGVQGVAQHSALVQILVYAVPFVAFGFVGAFCAVVFKRWGMNGVFTLTLTTALALGGLIALVTWLRQWRAIGQWLLDQPTASLIAGWPVLLAVVLAGAGYLAIRRATP
jgi:hypothetical protein